MHNEIGGWLWFVIDVVLVLALAAGMVYGVMRWRQWRKHPVAAKERDQATREAYGREEG